MPLFDEGGVPLYPELMGKLDALKRGRIGGPRAQRLGRARKLADRARRSLSHAPLRAAGLRNDVVPALAASPRALKPISATPIAGIAPRHDVSRPGGRFLHDGTWT